MHALPATQPHDCVGFGTCADRSGGNSGASSEQSTPVLPLKPALHRRPTSSGEGAASAPRGGGESSQGSLSYRFGGSLESWDWLLVLARTDAGSSQSAGAVSVCVSFCTEGLVLNLVVAQEEEQEGQMWRSSSTYPSRSACAGICSGVHSEATRVCTVLMRVCASSPTTSTLCLMWSCAVVCSTTGVWAARCSSAPTPPPAPSLPRRRRRWLTSARQPSRPCTLVVVGILVVGFHRTSTNERVS